MSCNVEGLMGHGGRDGDHDRSSRRSRTLRVLEQRVDSLFFRTVRVGRIPPFAAAGLTNAGARAEKALRHIRCEIEVGPGPVAMLAPTITGEYPAVAIRTFSPLLLHIIADYMTIFAWRSHRVPSRPPNRPFGFDASRYASSKSDPGSPSAAPRG